MLHNTSPLHVKKSSALKMWLNFPTLLTAKLELIVICGFPDFPFLVVNKITPLADLAPNTAAELASFKISIVAISLGLISLKEPG